MDLILLIQMLKEFDDVSLSHDHIMRVLLVDDVQIFCYGQPK